MTEHPDLEPAAARLARLLEGISDDQLDAPTPCVDYTLGDLVEHVGGLSLAFAAAGAKRVGTETGQAPKADASRLPADWRVQWPARLAALAEAWRDPAAWEGMTQVGGVDLPGAVTGRVGMNELVVHSWDIARASGQPYEPAGETVAAAVEFVAAVTPPNGAPAADGVFGPVVEVPSDASPLDCLVGLTGRDPAWQPR